jgi:hypothetical protein
MSVVNSWLEIAQWLRSTKFPVVVVTLLMLACLDIRVGIAQSVAIHATQQEIDIWRQRQKQRPYLNDWNRISGRADEFLRDPSSALWEGNQTDEQWERRSGREDKSGTYRRPGRTKGDGLRDAAFVFLVTRNEKYRDVVLQTLLKQATSSGTDFTNKGKWNSSRVGHDPNLTTWLRKLVYGYSYVRFSASQAEKDVLDKWFRDVGIFWDAVVHEQAAIRFPKRYEDDYSTRGNDKSLEEPLGRTHYGGPMVYKFHRAWFNQPAATNALVGAIGVMLGDRTLTDHAKRFVKEWLMFAVAPDGSTADQRRWNEGTPLQGFSYSGTVIGSILTVADHLARAGDPELYEFKTSAGILGWGGGPKSILTVMQHFANIAIGERNLGGGVKLYATTDNSPRADKIIGPQDKGIEDIFLIPANLYYNDPTCKKAYTRALPRKPRSGGYDVWGGDWGTYPSIPFMFGNLEGVVNPYPKRH